MAGLPDPKSTAVAPVKLVPVMVTWPARGRPSDGAHRGDGGRGTLKVNWSAAPVALVPPAAVTVTSTVAGALGGEVAVMDVALLTVKVVAGLPEPKLTAVAPVKLVPVTVTVVPPAVGPVPGLTAVTVGGGGGRR